MAEITFGSNAVPATEVAAEVINPTPVTSATPPLAVATVPSGAVATNNWLLGDKLPSFAEVAIPHINLIANIGELSKQFEPGSIVFGQELPLFIPPKIVNGAITRASTPPVIVTALGFWPTRFVEKVEGGGKGMLVKTEAEVAAAGGTLDWGTWKAKKASGIRLFQELADAMVLIQRPEACADDDSVFVYEANGLKYTIAIWSMKGTAYTEAAKKKFFKDRRMGCLKSKGYPSFSYALTTREKPFATGNTTWIPVLVANKPTTPEVWELAKELIGS
jgi:hypothetical protein